MKISLMSINSCRMTTTQGSPRKPYENSLFYSLSLLMNTMEDEIKPSNDCIDTSRSWTLE